MIQQVYSPCHFNIVMAFVNISKSKVLQDARMFNNAAEVMKDPKKCINLLEQLLYLVTVKGEELTATEASDVFFGVTKLFQCDNVYMICVYFL